MRFLGAHLRYYCSKLTASTINVEKVATTKKTTIDFKDLKFTSKVPCRPHIDPYKAGIQHEPKQDIHIDSQLIQLLERLSLVDLSSREAFETLKSSIEFAQQIENIPTDNVEPLYTVLEDLDLCLREDEVTEGDCQAEILSNAQKIEEDYFVAPLGNQPLEQETKAFSDK